MNGQFHFVSCPCKILKLTLLLGSAAGLATPISSGNLSGLEHLSPSGSNPSGDPKLKIEEKSKTCGSRMMKKRFEKSDFYVVREPECLAVEFHGRG
jgi:hypothetical protein